MKILLTICLACVFNIVHAQQYPTVSRYSVDGIEYYEVSDCTPGSIISFYSSIHGGRWLRSQAVDTNGKVLVQADSNFHPAMVLNKGTGGSLQVACFDTVEFTLANRSIVGQDQTASTEWLGQGSPKGNVYFQIYKSTDGRNYQPSKEIFANSGNILQPYHYTESWSGSATMYKIAVVSRTKGVRYMSPPMLLSNPNGITVFPTIVSSALSVTVPQTADVEAYYAILAIDGKKIQEGKLTATRSFIPVNKLPAGNYLVSVRCGLDRKVSQVTKL